MSTPTCDAIPKLDLFPVLGPLMAMRRDPLAFMTEASTHGELVELGRLGPSRAMLISDPRDIEWVLRRNHRGYAKFPGFVSAARPVFGEGLVFSDGEVWRGQRKIMQPAFLRRRLQGLTPLIAGAVEDLLTRWSTLAAADELPDVAAEMSRLTQELFVVTMFGASVRDDLDELLDAWMVVNRWVTERIVSPLQIPAAWPTPANRRMREALEVLRAKIAAIIDARRGAGGPRDDLLGLMMAGGREGCPAHGAAAPMTDEQLRDQVMTTFFAGFETTATALAWVWQLLAAHPQVERRLHAELERTLGDRTPTAEDLPALDYTRAVFDETLRLYPSVHLMARRSLRPDVVAGRQIPAGVTLFMSPWVTHRSPRYWEDPTRFDPARFTPDARAARERFAYFPFGGGPRLCIGRELARIEARIAVAMIARRFRVRPVGERPRLEALFTLRLSDAPVRLIERERPLTASRAPESSGAV